MVLRVHFGNPAPQLTRAELDAGRQRERKRKISYLQACGYRLREPGRWDTFMSETGWDQPGRMQGELLTATGTTEVIICRRTWEPQLSSIIEERCQGTEPGQRLGNCLAPAVLRFIELIRRNPVLSSASICTTGPFRSWPMLSPLVKSAA